MKTDNILIFGSLLFTFLAIFGSRPSSQSSYYTNKAIGDINRKFQQDLALFTESTAHFYEIVEEFRQGKSGKKRMTSAYNNLRRSFKQIEFIVEYLDSEAFNKTLNGAPLPKLEQKVADLTILEPKGLQVIDELMGGDLEEKDRGDLSEIASKLMQDTRKIERYLALRTITDRQFFEAARLAVIRMATLGVTGFDTPGTKQGILDVYTVLSTQQVYFELYEPELKQVGKTECLQRFKQVVQIGMKRAKDEDFDTFNRLKFTKEVVNPLYALIKEIHLGLDYETIDEVSRFPLAFNYMSDHIFEKDFLNKFYFVSIPEDEHFDSIEALGKLLFYDPVLSKNNDMACATCHSPDKAFTDGLVTSKSNSGKDLKRNAQTLNYAGYSSAFFHDLGTKRLEDQFEHVVLSKDEFNSSYAEILKKLMGSKTYTTLFKNAFPNQVETIASNNVDYALAAYVMKLSSFDNPVDLYFQGLKTSLPIEVERGYNLFTGKANCATCHFTPLYSGLVPPLFTETEAEVLGVPNFKTEPWVLDDDLGRLGNGVTQEVAYFYEAAFKTPTIRNIDITAPYMHNGVFESLEEVMDFYNKGGGVGLGIKLDHQTLSSDPLNLTETEVADIITFMKHLTDKTIFEAPSSLPKDFEQPFLNTRNLVK